MPLSTLGHLQWLISFATQATSVILSAAVVITWALRPFMLSCLVGVNNVNQIYQSAALRCDALAYYYFDGWSL